MPRTISAEAVFDALPIGARVLVQGGAGESQAFADAIKAAGAARPDISFVGVFIPGVNEGDYGAAAGRRLETFFVTSKLKAFRDNVSFSPLSYTEIARYLAGTTIDAAIFTAAPPDDAGICSFGAAVDFLAELWPRIPIRIAHLNSAMPLTHGHPGIPRHELTAVLEQRAPLLTLADVPADEAAKAIAAHVAALIPDGATLQAGIGKLPGACMRALGGKRHLRIHSGFISDWAFDLLEAGAIAADAPVTTGLAIGSERLYAQLASPRFAFRPVSYTHSGDVMRGLKNFVTLNGALEVDLLGQIYGECGPNGLISGPGGASDFARGAKLADGVRVIMLPADAQRGAVSRIVGPSAGRGPVSLSRFDVDIVVTQFGAADLRGCGSAARAARLIAIAAPDHRDELRTVWARHCEAGGSHA